HIHPALVLSLFYLSFSALVADPVSTLIRLCFPIAALQGLYSVLCLPTAHAGSFPKGGAIGKRKHKPGEKRKDGGSELARKIVTKKRKERRHNETDNDLRVQPILLSLLLTLSLATPILLVLLILFGAPLTTHFAHNLLCATHMALLALTPLFYVYGVDPALWREICSASLPGDAVWGGTVGTVVGAWLGAVPIPLDWDREWQKWPVTIITGAYVGWAVGRLVGEFLLKGKRVQFD
ncbi:MAG: hypothetical protein LQ348_003316, partial [Seirophora lacunosa]